MSSASKSERVAQLVEVPVAGGAEAMAIDIAGGLAARGHASHLIVVRGQGPFRERIPPSVEFHDLARPPFHGSPPARFGQFLGSCRGLEDCLREHKIEVLQTHLPMANFMGLFVSWRGSCRVFPTVHNNREFDYGNGTSALRRWLRRAAYRQMLGRCPGLIAVSEQVKSSLVAQLGTPDEDWKRVKVVPNGVRVPTPVPADERVAIRASLGVRESEQLVVGAGRLTHQKNFGDLVEALAALAPGTPEWRCIIAGEGELRRDLERRIAAFGLQDRVRLAGLVGDMPRLLAAADVFCLPSLYEGLPLALLEAMAAGLPVVAYAIEGVTDVVRDRAQGKLAAPGDTSGLAAAISSLMRDAAERSRLGAAARGAVAARHSFDTVIDQLEAVYNS